MKIKNRLYDILNKHVLKECEEKCVQYEKDKNDLQQMYMQVSEEVQQSTNDKSYLQIELQNIESRIKNVKANHFVMVKDLSDQLSTVREWLDTLNNLLMSN